MKTNPAVNMESLIEKAKELNVPGEDRSFIRSGRVGQWKEVMSDAISETFLKIDEEKLKGTGFFLNY